MTPDIGTNLNWQPALGADGIVSGLEDIDQCIRIILSTPKGSVPHRPDFACDIHKYIDWPQDRAVAFIVREAREAILKFEPRVEDVQFTVVHSVGGIEITVDWLPAAGGDWQQSVVGL
jgi:hypothetical protein